MRDDHRAASGETRGHDVLRSRPGALSLHKSSRVESTTHVLRVYRISPDVQTKNGGSGTIQVKSFITLRDPDHRINFPIVAADATYPSSAIPVDAAIGANGWLTGGDFDIESFRESSRPRILFLAVGRTIF